MIQPANPSNTPTVVHSHTRRSCDELGLCQRRKPACPGCTCHDTSLLAKGAYYFAPGAIEGGRGKQPLLRRWGVRNGARYVAATCLAITALASCSYSVGYISVLLGERL